MTKTQAREIARQARRHGYYRQLNSAEVKVTCPRCRQWVTGVVGYRYRLARKGEPATTDPHVLGGRRVVYERQTVIQALDAAMVAHLLDEDACVVGA